MENYTRHDNANIHAQTNWWTKDTNLKSSKGTIFHVAGSFYGESNAHRLIPLTKAVTRFFDVLFDLRLNKRLSNHSRRHRAHYDVTVITVPPMKTIATRIIYRSAKWKYQRSAFLEFCDTIPRWPMFYLVIKNMFTFRYLNWIGIFWQIAS